MEGTAEVGFHGITSVAFKFGMVSHFHRLVELDVFPMDSFVRFTAYFGLAGREAAVIIDCTIIHLGAVFIVGAGFLTAAIIFINMTV